MGQELRHLIGHREHFEMHRDKYNVPSAQVSDHWKLLRNVQRSMKLIYLTMTTGLPLSSSNFVSQQIHKRKSVLKLIF